MSLILPLRSSLLYSGSSLHDNRYSCAVQMCFQSTRSQICCAPVFARSPCCCWGILKPLLQNK